MGVGTAGGGGPVLLFLPLPCLLLQFWYPLGGGLVPRAIGVGVGIVLRAIGVGVGIGLGRVIVGRGGGRVEVGIRRASIGVG